MTLHLPTLCLLTLTLAQSGKIDWKLAAERATWTWSDEHASPLYCIDRQISGDYDARIEKSYKDRWKYRYAIGRDGRDIYSWEGHRSTVFRIIEDRLYYGDWGTASSGAFIVAIDLTTGQQLWKQAVRGLGPIEHSSYQNLLNLDAGGEVVSIAGNESGGRFIEFKNRETGETVGHKVFERGS